MVSEKSQKLMSAREHILNQIKAAQPQEVALPDLTIFDKKEENKIDLFVRMSENVGSKVFEVADFLEIEEIVKKTFPEAKKITSNVNELAIGDKENWISTDPHALADVDLHIIKAGLGVAENGAVWLNEMHLGQRVAPTINEHLAVILNKSDIVNEMHEAYEITNSEDYGYGLFLGGPSKTADIEQILVMGAHGARSMHLFLLPQ